MAEHPTADRSMGARLAGLEARRAEAINAGSQRSVKAHRPRQMTARERIDYLLDEDSFQEMDLLVPAPVSRHGPRALPPLHRRGGHRLGTIDERRVCVFSQDFTVFGGRSAKRTPRRSTRSWILRSLSACDHRPRRFWRGTHPRGRGLAAQLWRDLLPNVRASGVVPQISVILGPCAGGAVYSPAMTDFIFMVHETSHMFITGPDVVKTVTVRTSPLSSSAGAMSHATRSGVATFVAPNEKACLDEVRYLLSFHYFEQPRDSAGLRGARRPGRAGHRASRHGPGQPQPAL